MHSNKKSLTRALGIHSGWEWLKQERLRTRRSVWMSYYGPDWMWKSESLRTDLKQLPFLDPENELSFFRCKTRNVKVGYSLTSVGQTTMMTSAKLAHL